MMWIDAVVLATEHLPCACTAVARITIGPFSVPVGPVTMLFAAVIVLIAPAALYGRIRRHLEARAMRAVLVHTDATPPGSAVTETTPRAAASRS